MMNHDDDDIGRIRPDAYGRRIEPDYPDLSMDRDPENHTGFFVDVWAERPLTEAEKETLEAAIYHICHDNLEYDLQKAQVEVHRAPVVKDGPNHWEGTL